MRKLVLLLAVVSVAGLPATADAAKRKKKAPPPAATTQTAPEIPIISPLFKGIASAFTPQQQKK